MSIIKEVQIVPQMNGTWAIIRDGGIVLGGTEDNFYSRDAVELYCKENNFVITNNPPKR